MFTIHRHLGHKEAAHLQHIDQGLENGYQLAARFQAEEVKATI